MRSQFSFPELCREAFPEQRQGVAHPSFFIPNRMRGIFRYLFLRLVVGRDFPNCLSPWYNPGPASRGARSLGAEEQPVVGQGFGLPLPTVGRKRTIPGTFTYHLALRPLDDARERTGSRIENTFHLCPLTRLWRLDFAHARHSPPGGLCSRSIAKFTFHPPAAPTAPARRSPGRVCRPAGAPVSRRYTLRA